MGLFYRTPRPASPTSAMAAGMMSWTRGFHLKFTFTGPLPTLVSSRNAVHPQDVATYKVRPDRDQVAANDEVQGTENISAQNLNVGPWALREHDGHSHHEPRCGNKSDSLPTTPPQ